MTITIHANSLKNIKLIDRILIAGNYSFQEKEEPSEEIELSAQDFRKMIKARIPRMVGKSLQNI
jgi:hypothetical protein